jgi:hypothetical protein
LRRLPPPLFALRDTIMRPTMHFFSCIKSAGALLSELRFESILTSASGSVSEAAIVDAVRHRFENDAVFS